MTWDEIVAALPPADREKRAELRRQANALEARRPTPPAQAWTFQEDGSARFSYVLKRGSLSQKGARVEPGFPSVLVSRSADTTPLVGATLNRLDLAKWLTRPDQPLTARVMVNRLWEHHFGRGIVATPDDFGAHGEAPTHPELLDWLAVELVERGWSLKHVHRLMVLSNTYRQDSRPLAQDADGKRIDPDNHLLWRMNRRRLDADALRDCVLATAGTLNPEVGGPMVKTPLEPKFTRRFSARASRTVCGSSRPIRASIRAAASISSRNATFICRFWKCSTSRIRCRRARCARSARLLRRRWSS